LRLKDTNVLLHLITKGLSRRKLVHIGMDRLLVDTKAAL